MLIYITYTTPVYPSLLLTTQDLADDLAQLSYLHEAAVFSGIKNRFLHQEIYTYSGIVLIAMNPFAKVDMYSPEIMREYIGKRRDEMDPHVVMYQSFASLV
jgi:myosin-5